MSELEDLVEGHLSERALEALAGEREELLAADARTHLDACAECRERVAEARREFSTVSAALRIDLGGAELDALVRAALDATAPAPSSLVRAPSRRALVVAAILGALASLGLGVLSLDGVPSIGRFISVAHDVRAVSSAVDRLVDALLPGGWGALALVLSALLAALLVPLRALAAPRRSTGSLLARAGTLTLVLLLGVLFVPGARALDFAGDWPEGEQLSVVAEGVPASVALERAAQAAGLGFVGALATDPPTNLRVRNASLRDIVAAVLGSDAPFVAERTATLLIVRSVETPAAVAPPPPAPMVAPAVTQSTPPPRPPVPSDRAARGDARDRISFGGNVVVRADEVVESVVTMGGNATIDGEVLRDVVTMGGNVYVRRGGVVHGEIVAMGGEVEVDDGARASAVDFGALSGGRSVRHRDSTGNEPRDRANAGRGMHVEVADAASDAAGALAEWVHETFASASRHALLFLFGLLLLGLVPARLDEVTRAVAAVPLRAGATGLLAALAAAVLAVVLVITIVGIPGAVVLALLAALCVYGGLVGVAAVIGRVLPIRALEARPVLQLAAGVLVLFVVSLVPFVGELVPVVAGCVGLGAVVLTRAGTRAA